LAEAKFRNVDEYIASFPADVQDALTSIRRTVKEAVPEALEKISYHMAAYTLDGRRLIYFAAYQRHIGVYGHSSAALEAYKEETSRYVGEKGALRLPLDEPMPLSLLQDIVTFTAKEIAEDPTKRPRG
jgi:uncharacterized protein YdhG (YjbR/CyaY superfamily)